MSWGFGEGDSYYRPSSFEVASSWVHGLCPAARVPHDDMSPRATLDSLLRPALVAGACFVAFSGGRDSSAVLAAATSLARREGYADPVPVTEVYPDIPEADESRWQSRVLEYLGLTEWLRLEIRQDNDLLGSTATAGLLARGLIWPPVLQTKSTLLTALSQGWLFTGEGGDEVFGARRSRPLRLVRNSFKRPQPRIAFAAVKEMQPRFVRRRVIERQLLASDLQPWLRPAINRAHLAMLATDAASEPLDWRRSVWWLQRRRSARVTQHNYRLLAAEHQVTLVDPFLAPAFLAAVGSIGGRLGFPSRTDLMSALFGDILPADVVGRQGKAFFNRAFMGESTRQFALDWNGSGVDHDLVDADLLRAEWLSDSPSAISSVLLQSAWLAGQPAEEMS